MTSYPLRHLHLDFHTSEHIAGVGEAFSAEAFVRALRRAEVESVNLFARCWHGWLYYDSARFPERKHPRLKRNLLQEQVQACHREGIRTVIYLAVQYDYYTAMNYPEWLSQTTQGCVGNGLTQGQGPFEAGFRRSLCLNSPFRGFMKAQVEEILDLFPVDGFWFDGVMLLDDASVWTREQMEGVGLDPTDRQQRLAFGQQVVDAFKLEFSELIRSRAPEASIFYNNGHVDPSVRSSLRSYTHLEVESLPGDVWGYDHLPITGRYVRTLGKPWFGMTAKFHTGWGDLHSFKSKAALEYECMQMLALGAGCSVGDQLHPSGAVCKATYDLIGSVYAQVKAKEPWCRGAQRVTEIAVVLTDPEPGDLLSPSARGALHILQVGSHQFDFVDGQDDLNLYKLVILPDDIGVDTVLAKKLESFVSDGGSLVSSYKSGLNEDKFVLDLGVTFAGDAPYSPDFVRTRNLFETDLVDTEYVMYRGGLAVTAGPDTQVLADTYFPYFNRSYAHFHSHLHAPSSGEVGGPAIVQSRNTIYFSHPVFELYASHSPAWCQELVLAAIRRLLRPLVRHDGPSTLQVHLTELATPDADSWVIHLLHYIPTRKSPHLEVIDDVIPLFNVGVWVQVDQPVREVRTVPEGALLAFEKTASTVYFVLPELHGHQLVQLKFD